MFPYNKVALYLPSNLVAAKQSLKEACTYGIKVYEIPTEETLVSLMGTIYRDF